VVEFGGEGLEFGEADVISGGGREQLVRQRRPCQVSDRGDGVRVRGCVCVVGALS